jgi:hypothetical protein
MLHSVKKYDKCDKEEVEITKRTRSHLNQQQKKKLGKKSCKSATLKEIEN